MQELTSTPTISCFQPLLPSSFSCSAVPSETSHFPVLKPPRSFYSSPCCYAEHFWPTRGLNRKLYKSEIEGVGRLFKRAWKQNYSKDLQKHRGVVIQGKKYGYPNDMVIFEVAPDRYKVIEHSMLNMNCLHNQKNCLKIEENKVHLAAKDIERFGKYTVSYGVIGFFQCNQCHTIIDNLESRSQRRWVHQNLSSSSLYCQSTVSFPVRFLGPSPLYWVEVGRGAGKFMVDSIMTTIKWRDLDFRIRFTARLILGMLFSVKEFHDQGFIHRNIHENNFLVSSEKNEEITEVRLTGFDVAVKTDWELTENDLWANTELPNFSKLLMGGKYDWRQLGLVVQRIAINFFSKEELSERAVLFSELEKTLCLFQSYPKKEIIEKLMTLAGSSMEQKAKPISEEKLYRFEELFPLLKKVFFRRVAFENGTLSGAVLRYSGASLSEEIVKLLKR